MVTVLGNSVRQNTYSTQCMIITTVDRHQRARALWLSMLDKKGKVHPCTVTEALYRPYGP